MQFENEGDCEWIIVTDYQGFCIGTRGIAKDDLAGYVAQLIKLSNILLVNDANNSNDTSNKDGEVSIAINSPTYGSITLKSCQNMVIAIKRRTLAENITHVIA